MDSPEQFPASVVLPDPVVVRDLAAALHIKWYRVINELIRLKVFASADTQIDFATAATVCGRFGVEATKAT
jgi:hypothetical protein